jgi:hypothetical protein
VKFAVPALEGVPEIFPVGCSILSPARSARQVQ